MGDLARVTHDLVATIEEQVRQRGTDSLRGSSRDDGLLFRSHANLRVRAAPSSTGIGPHAAAY